MTNLRCREGKGREGKGREGKGREGGREKGQGEGGKPRKKVIHSRFVRVILAQGPC